MTSFASPATTGTLAPADVNGHLLLIRPISLEQNVPTTYGVSDAIRCNVADLSTGMLHENVLWFPRVLVSSLQSRMDQMVLAVMGQGQPKPGQSPPWVLNDASNDPNAVQAAQAWLAQNPAFDPSRPNITAPVTSTPVYQAPPAAAPVPPQPVYQTPAPAAVVPGYQAPAATYQPAVNPADV